jgi:hypothetical protein
LRLTSRINKEAMGDQFGWELFRTVLKAPGATKKAVVVAFVHWRLWGQDFRCVGAGESFEGPSAAAPSEQIPADWDHGEAPLKYLDLKSKNQFILRCFSSDADVDNVVIVLTRVSDLESAAATVPLSSVKDDKSDVVDVAAAKATCDHLWKHFRKKRSRKSPEKGLSPLQVQKHRQPPSSSPGAPPWGPRPPEMPRPRKSPPFPPMDPYL